MKKLLFSVLLIALQCSTLLAQSDGAIYIDVTKPDNTNNRFTVKIQNSQSVCKIEAAVSSLESYTIYFENHNDSSIRFECDLITDGLHHTYLLPGLPAGIYVFCINTPTHKFAQKILIN